MPASGHVATRVCILLEGNAPMARHWNSFLNIYLVPLLKGLELQPSGLTEVSLVVYYTRSTYSLCRLERSDWVSSWKEVHSLLAAAHISGGGNSESCLPEAVAEALYLFQTPSALKPTEQLAQHCLLFSLLEAHNMAISWPYPLPPGANNQGSQVASFSLGMAEAFKQRGISLSVFSTYPPGLNNTSWPSLLFKLFAHVEQGQTHRVKAEQQQQQQQQQQQHQQQQQQQQRGKLREECSVGMMPGHFVMLSRQWGPVVHLLQGQRNKRKAEQAFQEVPITDYQGKHAAAFSTAPHHAAKALKTEPAAGQQPSPFLAAATAAAAAPVKAETRGAVNTGQHTSAPVDLTSPTVGPRLLEPATVDLTNEESPQMAPGPPHVTDRLQLQPKGTTNAAMHRHPSQPLPAAHSQQHRPPQAALSTPPAPQPYPSQGPAPPQQPPSLPLANARQQSPSPASSSLTLQQQQKLLLHQQQQRQQLQQAQLRQFQQQQQQQQHQQQQRQRPASAHPQAVAPPGQQQQPHVYSQAPASLQHPQLQQYHPQLQQQQHPQLHLSPQQQQQQQWQAPQTAAAAAAEGQGRQQAETARQLNRPSSASPPQGVPPTSQAQQQLLNLQQQLRLQQQGQLPQQLPQGQVVASPHAGRVMSGQNQTLQQIQTMQTQLKGRSQGQSQGPAAAALPQHSFTQGQGQLAVGTPQINCSPGQVRQGQVPAALPQASSGQLPAFSPARAEAVNGVKPVPVPAMRSPTASSSGSAAASPDKSGGGPPVLVWDGEIHLAAHAMRAAESQQLMRCRLLAKCGTWPPGRQPGWGHPLTVTKNIFNADLTKLLGPDAFTQAPRLAVQVMNLSDKGKTYIQDLANQKAMGIIQVPTAGKFLGLLVTSPPGTPQPKLLALVLNLPQQQIQRPFTAQR